MRRSFLAGFAACLAATAVVLAAPREARAGLFLGGEFNAASPLGAPTGYQNGYGFVGTLGYRIGLGPVFLQPEAEGSYLTFPFEQGAGPATHATRVLGGGRFGLGALVQPTVFGHTGVGWLGEGVNGRAFDVGFALGFKLIPYLRFGGQIAYNVITIQNDPRTMGTTAWKWLSYGANAGIEF